MIDAKHALQRLKDGNKRYLSDDIPPIQINAKSRRELLNSQFPFAIVLGCSDSRVPAEIIFGQGLGDLFVIRVAGNVVAPSQIGSIEFAAEKFGTSLVVVLGHTMCGAVEATIEQLRRPTELRSPHLHSIVSRIRPSVEPLLDGEHAHDEPALMRDAVRANIETSVANLRHGSEILVDLLESGKLMIVGAEYCLESGVVDFFDE
jgi:carbonic anhydrase